ncbi:methyltransferase type 11 [Candidatus Vecturithrix granuli]|uniref:Methyltransferase type 11 n=1 Tax=Vecturithrix granuli TaxID=1499967 RepID=A0A081C967_VECG1|nr:methyltransferase type 11 [Candidatus Vecturithrix granuli]
MEAAFNAAPIFFGLDAALSKHQEEQPDMKQPTWLAYHDLAWTESIITSPAEYAEDTEYFGKIINDNSRIEAKTLLHLGCGAGGNDGTFKKHFKVTGVDISEGMLAIARRLNPEVRYIGGDMRNIQLKETFDAVAIPDSIGYMITQEDLRQAIMTAYKHLKPGGILLIVALISEDFRSNNFVYTGSRGDIEVTIFENNYFCEFQPTMYEATFAYLIRRKGNLEVFFDRHTLGLFPLTTWVSLLTDVGFELEQDKMEHSYDRFMPGEGEYHLRVFACRKP